MKYLCILIAIAFSACAGSKIDTDFRSKVKSDTTSITGNYDPVSKSTSGTVTNTVEFRDPSKDQ